MYFIELVTTEHKVGITILYIKKKKNLAQERNGSNLFLIYPTSHSLHYFHAFRHSACLPRSVRMYAETEQHCFYTLLSRGFACPSHPSTQFTFLPVKTSRSRCCYLPSFQQPVTSTSFSLLQKLSLSTFWMHSLWFLIPDHHKSQNDGRKESSCEWNTEGCRCNKVIYFFPSVSKADFIDFPNLKHSHCRNFYSPIDWNWLPWGPLVL